MRMLIPMVLIALYLTTLPSPATASGFGNYFSLAISTWDGGGPYYSGSGYSGDRDRHIRHGKNRHVYNSREYQMKHQKRHFKKHHKKHVKKRHSHRHGHKYVAWTPPSRGYYKKHYRDRHQSCYTEKRPHRHYRW